MAPEKFKTTVFYESTVLMSMPSNSKQPMKSRRSRARRFVVLGIIFPFSDLIWQEELLPLFKAASKSKVRVLPAKLNQKVEILLPEIFCRSSRQKVFCKEGKHLFQSLFFNKVEGLRSVNFLWIFPVNFAKFLRAPFFTKHLRWLLLIF